MYQCPSCHTSIIPSSLQSNLIQCSCKQLWRISQGGYLMQAEVSLPHQVPHTYLQPGSTGNINGKNFTVTGRLAVREDGSTYNYWNICLSDGSVGLLAESYGHYSILIPEEGAVKIDEERIYNYLKAGNQIQLKPHKAFRLVRSRHYDYIFAEGEMYIPLLDGELSVFEFFSSDGEYYEIHFYKDALSKAYRCSFFLPQELKFQNTINATAPRHFRCQCGKILSVHAHHQTFSLTCESCYNYYIYNPALRDYTRTNKQFKPVDPFIKVGTVGVMDNIEFKVVGYSRKQEKNDEQYEWNEYTLYNPMQGFAYLSEFQGHWVYVKEWPRPPLITLVGENYFIENDNEFKLFNRYRYIVIGAEGEHIYDLRNAHEYFAEEYIHPPQILISEMGSMEECWFYGEHFEAAEIEKRFSLHKGLPVQIGVGAVQPVALLNVGWLILTTVICMLFLTGIHFLFVANAQNRTIFEQTFYFANNDTNSVKFNTTKFKLNRRESNLEVKIASFLNNQWIEVNGTLVNSATGKEYSFSKGVEHYHGYEDGEKWQEGSDSGDKLLTEIPVGTYFLEMEATRSKDGYNKPESFEISVCYDTPVHRNLLFPLLLVALAGLSTYIYFYYYDKQRWENSSYTPYKYDE